MLNVKPGQWLTKEEQAVSLRSTRLATVPGEASNAPTQVPVTQLNVASNAPTQAPVTQQNLNPPRGEMLNADFWGAVLIQPGINSEPLSAAMPRANATPLGSRTEGLQPRANVSAGYPSLNGTGLPQQPGSSMIPPPTSSPTNFQTSPINSGALPALSRSPSVSWGVEDVIKYLESIELGHLTTKFRENGVDGLMLQELSDEDLMTELGCTKLQARKIRQRKSEY